MLSQGAGVDFVSAQGSGYAVIDPLAALIGQEVEGAGEIGEVLLQIGQRIAAFAVEYQYPVRKGGEPANIIVDCSLQPLQAGVQADAKGAGHHRQVRGAARALGPQAAQASREETFRGAEAPALLQLSKALFNLRQGESDVRPAQSLQLCREAHALYPVHEENLCNPPVGGEQMHHLVLQHPAEDYG